MWCDGRVPSVCVCDGLYKFLIYLIFQRCDCCCCCSCLPCGRLQLFAVFFSCAWIPSRSTHVFVPFIRWLFWCVRRTDGITSMMIIYFIIIWLTFFVSVCVRSLAPHISRHVLFLIKKQYTHIYIQRFFFRWFFQSISCSLFFLSLLLFPLGVSLRDLFFRFIFHSASKLKMMAFVCVCEELQVELLFRQNITTAVSEQQHVSGSSGNS